MTKALADVAIHFPIDDLQISEDTRFIIGHMKMQCLHAQRADIESATV